MALAAMAPEVDEWPLYVFVALSIVLSIAGFFRTRRVEGIIRKVLGYGTHSLSLAFSGLIIYVVTATFFKAVPEKYVIPAGYKGEVYVIFGVPNGRPVEKEGRTLVYRIPSDGIMLTSAQSSPELFRSSYYFQKTDGSLDQIKNEWLSTVENTPENLNNNSDWGIYFPRSGSGGTDKCTVHFDLFYVGTKAHLLKDFRETDLAGYLQKHPEVCNPQTK